MIWLSEVRLSNQGNDCYQNAALVAMFWALLQLDAPTWNDLGEGAERFAELFSLESICVSLKDMPAFSEFLRPWGEGQQDLHEFLSQFVAWIKPPCVNSSWRRIAMEGELIQIRDRGHHIIHRLSALQITRKRLTCNPWTHYLSTCMSSFGSICLGSLRSATKEGLGAHHGLDGAGHLQATGLSTQGWMLFDDLKEAKVMGSHPPMTSQWIFVWLASEDKQHNLKFECYPEDVLSRLRAFCCACGRLVVSHEALKNSGTLNSFRLCRLIISCRVIVQKPVSHVMAAMRAKCSHIDLMVELNARIGLEVHKRQTHQSSYFALGRTLPEERNELQDLVNSTSK